MNRTYFYSIPLFSLIFVFVISTVTIAAIKPHRTGSTGDTYPVSLYSGLRWRSIGPYRGGRAVVAAGVPDDPYTYYLGTAGGGLLKTTDGGKTWINISDGYFHSSGVGAIAVAPSDPNVIYVGMGETNIRGDITPGDGVYKSTDAGKTWTNIGLDSTHFISKIIVDPRDPSKVYVAAMGHVFKDNPARGVYYSADGGKTWKKILYKDEKTGAIDLAMDPNNPRILYAAMWQAYRAPWGLSSGGPGSSIYKSTDGGATWKDLTKNPGLPKGILGKIGLAVSHGNSTVWAMIEAKHGGLFRSNNGGKTWKLVNDNHDITLRPWYYTKIFVDPNNDNVLYTVDEELWKSIDAGKTFQSIDTPHGDNHDLWINPNNSKIMVETNDGGGTVTFNGGKTWTKQDQNIGQFYHVSLDNRFPYQIYGAQQDFSSLTIKSRTKGNAITSDAWYPVAGGESGYVWPKPDQPTITFGGGYEGDMERHNEVTKETFTVAPWPEDMDGYGAVSYKYRFKWTFPIMFSPFNPDAMYVGCQYVLKSMDEGRTWQQISPDLTRNDKSKQQPSGGPITTDETGTENYDTIFSLAESPVQKGVLWAGSDDGLIHVSMDDGQNWKDVTPKNLSQFKSGALVSMIEASHYNAGTAYVAVNRYMDDDFHPYVYKTTDFGAHWKMITDGLPDNEIVRAVREDPEKKGLLYLGTEYGVWVSFNDGGHWQKLQLNLPVVSVRDLQIQQRENDLVIATHGRGFWILDNLNPLRALSKKVERAGVYLFKPEHAYLMKGGNRWYAGEAAGQNPPNGAVIFYDLKKAPQSGTRINLAFETMSGDTVRNFTSVTGDESADSGSFYKSYSSAGAHEVTTDAGMNRFVWDLRYPDAVKVQGIKSGTFYSSKGPKVTPGMYKVILQVGDKTFSQNLEVRTDPRIQATPGDFAQRLVLLKKIHKDLNAVNRAINRIESIHHQVSNVLKKYDSVADAGNLKETGKALNDSLDAVEGDMIQKHITTDEDVLRYPVRLHTKISALGVNVGNSYARPTNGMEQVFDHLDRLLHIQLDRLNRILNSQVPAFNQTVNSLNVQHPVYINAVSNK